MASRGINKVILVGNLGKDPEMRYMTNGGAVTSITIATSESWRDKQAGETREVTEWHRVVFFGKLAEIAGQYLRKGSQVYVEGQLKTRKWQDKSGQERFTTEVVVNVGGTLQMLGGRPGQVGQDSDNNNGWGQPPQPEEHQFSGSGQPTRPASQQPETPSFANNEPPMDFDDDIPF